MKYAPKDHNHCSVRLDDDWDVVSVDTIEGKVEQFHWTQVNSLTSCEGERLPYHETPPQKITMKMEAGIERTFNVANYDLVMAIQTLIYQLRNNSIQKLEARSKNLSGWLLEIFPETDDRLHQRKDKDGKKVIQITEYVDRTPDDFYTNGTCSVHYYDDNDGGQGLIIAESVIGLDVAELIANRWLDKKGYNYEQI